MVKYQIYVDKRGPWKPYNTPTETIAKPGNSNFGKWLSFLSVGKGMQSWKCLLYIRKEKHFIASGTSSVNWELNWSELSIELKWIKLGHKAFIDQLWELFQDKLTIFLCICRYSLCFSLRPLVQANWHKG